MSAKKRVCDMHSSEIETIVNEHNKAYNLGRWFSDEMPRQYYNP